ncbi:MAG: hypothetical protein KJO80_14105 [Gammaproteobacteria bacterium]|nr:hypothetical protein [Gammaproteobacteria bacterium]NNK97813.1 hypothetical protein [Xanthomonadales bacterium]
MKGLSRYFTAIAFALMLIVPAVVSAGSSVSTVNKSIRIDDNSTAGNVDSVNGSVRIGDSSAVKSVDTVNGSIKLGNDVKVERGVESVNGAVTLKPGCRVDGDVDTVNGSIRLQDTVVGGDVTTVNGGIRLLEGTEVSGNVVVRKPGGWSYNKRRKPVKVEIGENVLIHGDLVFEHAVELRLHDSARVGEIIGEEVTIITP